MDEYYIDVTLSRLMDLYGKDTAIQLLSEQIDNIFDYHGLAWQLGRESFTYFCQVFLRYPLFDYSGDNIPLSKKHLENWKELQQEILHHNHSRNCYIYPRGFGKTNTISIPLAMWCALYCHTPYIVLLSAVESRAENFIATIKDWIADNPVIYSAFGEVKNKELTWNAGCIELDVKPRKAKIEAYSSTGSIRGASSKGQRISLLIADDAQTDAQVMSDKGCETVVNSFMTIMKTAQSSNDHVVAVGTIIRKNDLYDSIIHMDSFTKRVEPLIPIDDLDDYFNNHPHWREVKRLLKDGKRLDAEDYYENHKSAMDYPLIWEKYECFPLFCDYLDDPVSFKREYQGDIQNLGEKRIKELQAIPRETIEQLEFTKTILSCDPAATNNKKSDYSAFVVLSECTNGLRYARRCKIAKYDNVNDFVDEIIRLLLEFPDIDAVSIERQVYMGADVEKLREKLAASPELRNRTLQILNKSRNQNKDARIEAYVIADVNMGRIIFNSEDEDAIEQIKSFAGTKYTQHDDCIDALADAQENLQNINKSKGYFNIYNY